MITPDPIFAAIETHRQAHAVHLAAIAEADRIERGGRSTGIEEGHCVAENEAFDAMLGMAATTLGGLFAKLEYLRSIADSEEDWMITEREGAALLLIDSFTASLKILTAENARSVR